MNHCRRCLGSARPASGLDSRSQGYIIFTSPRSSFIFLSFLPHFRQQGVNPVLFHLSPLNLRPGAAFFHSHLPSPNSARRFRISAHAMSKSSEGADGPSSSSLKIRPWSWEQEQKGGQGNQKDQENPGQEESGYFANMQQWASDHPIQAAAIGAGAAVLVSPAIVASPALGLFGFGANGIVGGSIAAGAQSSIGSVVAPSLFATLQSAGAGGYGVAAVHGVVQGAAAGSLGVTGIRGWFKRRSANAKPGDGDEENDTADEPNEDGGPESNAPEDGGPQDQADEAVDARPDEL